MKILKIVKEMLAILGTSSTDSNRFNLKVIMVFNLLLLSILSIVMFMMSMGNVNLIDYMQSINILSLLVLASFCFAVMAFQQTKLLTFFEKLESLINKSNIFYLFAHRENAHKFMVYILNFQDWCAWFQKRCMKTQINVWKKFRVFCMQFL